MAGPSKARKRLRGSIDSLPSGALRVRVYAGINPVTKDRHYLVETIPPGPGAAELAEKARTELLSQVDNRRNPRTSATVNQLLTRYLDQFDGERSTLTTYRRYVRNHIEPLIGEAKVGNVDADVLDSLYAELRRCRAHCSGSNKRIDHRTKRDHHCDARCRPHRCVPLTASSIRQIHFILSGAFKRAVRWRWLSVNPVEQATPPPAPKPSPEPPTSEEAARILTEAWRDPDWGTLVWLTMTTGARRGEQCGLRWKHVDLEHGVLTYFRSIGQDSEGTWEKDTKTHQKRRVALDPDTVNVLTEHWQRCQERTTALGVSLGPDQFVFSGAPDAKEHLIPSTVTQRYGRLVKRLGIKSSIHKLRHYSATELIRAGIDVRTVAGRLGHGEGGAITLRVYTAWMSEADQRASLSLHARLPQRPGSAATAEERISANPRSPYEHLAVALRAQISDGRLAVGEQLPTVKAIAEAENVAVGTAHRAVTLLKDWGVVESVPGRRTAAVARIPEAVPAPLPSPDLSGLHPSESDVGPLDLKLRLAGDVLASFTANASASDPDKLERLLAGAVRRLGAAATDVALYELEVRQHGDATLLTTFVSTG